MDKFKYSSIYGSTNQNQWFAPQSMPSTGQTQWFSQALGPPPGFSPRSAYQPQAHFTGKGFDAPPVTSQAWYPNLGATHHVTNNADLLTESSTLPGIGQVLLCNG